MSGSRQQIADLETDTVIARSKDPFVLLHITLKITLMDMADRTSLNDERGDT